MIDGIRRRDFKVNTLDVASTSTLTGDVTCEGDLTVETDITCEGDFTCEGNFTFGDAATDDLAVAGYISTAAGKTTKFIETGTYQSTADGGLILSSTNTRPNSFLCDDSGSNIGTSVRNVLGRTMLTVDQSGGTIRSLMGQLKLADGVDLATGVYTGVQGYLELAGDTDIQSGAKASCMDISVEIASSKTLTVDSGGIFAGLKIETTGTGTLTNNGTCAAIYVDDGGTIDDWPVGIDLNNITTGIDIGACTTGINISGAATDGILIAGACSDNGIEITGACTDSCLKMTPSVAAGSFKGIHIAPTLTGTQVAACAIDVDMDYSGGDINYYIADLDATQTAVTAAAYLSRGNMTGTRCDINAIGNIDHVWSARIGATMAMAANSETNQFYGGLISASASGAFTLTLHDGLVGAQIGVSVDSGVTDVTGGIITALFTNCSSVAKDTTSPIYGIFNKIGQYCDAAININTSTGHNDGTGILFDTDTQTCSLDSAMQFSNSSAAVTNLLNIGTSGNGPHSALTVDTDGGNSNSCLVIEVGGATKYIPVFDTAT